MIVGMIDLFADRAIVGTRTNTDYEFVADGRVVASTRSRKVAATHWWSWAVRLLGSSSATRLYEIEVVDPSDVPRWLITLSPGTPNTYSAEVTLVDGTPVGRVSADGGTFNPFPKIELTAADGTAVGHGTSKGAPQFFDAADRPLTEFTWQGAERPFDKPRWRLSFLDPTLDAESRALVVAGIIAWELPR
ncbi:hypothetical protein GCM10028777_14310 [Angustibacter speluncae]